MQNFYVGLNGLLITKRQVDQRGNRQVQNDKKVQTRSEQKKAPRRTPTPGTGPAAGLRDEMKTSAQKKQTSRGILSIKQQAELIPATQSKDCESANQWEFGQQNTKAEKFTNCKQD